MRSDVVGIEPEANDALTDIIADWERNGPARMNRRTTGAMEIFEHQIGGQYLVAYIVDEERQRFALLWLREKPGGMKLPS